MEISGEIQDIVMLYPYLNALVKEQFYLNADNGTIHVLVEKKGHLHIVLRHLTIFF